MLSKLLQVYWLDLVTFVIVSGHGISWRLLFNMKYYDLQLLFSLASETWGWGAGGVHSLFLYCKHTSLLIAHHCVLTGQLHRVIHNQAFYDKRRILVLYLNTAHYFIGYQFDTEIC